MKTETLNDLSASNFFWEQEKTALFFIWHWIPAAYLGVSECWHKWLEGVFAQSVLDFSAK